MERIAPPIEWVLQQAVAPGKITVSASWQAIRGVRPPTARSQEKIFANGARLAVLRDRQAVPQTGTPDVQLQTPAVLS